MLTKSPQSLWSQRRRVIERSHKQVDSRAFELNLGLGSDLSKTPARMSLSDKRNGVFLISLAVPIVVLGILFPYGRPILKATTDEHHAPSPSVKSFQDGTTG